MKSGQTQAHQSHKQLCNRINKPFRGLYIKMNSRISFLALTGSPGSHSVCVCVCVEAENTSSCLIKILLDNIGECIIVIVTHKGGVPYL